MTVELQGLVLIQVQIPCWCFFKKQVYDSLQRGHNEVSFLCSFLFLT